MGIVVFWLETRETDSLAPGLVTESSFKEFNETELTSALAFAEKQRKDGRQHVIISTELSSSVGKPGVNSVENGKTPDGIDYEWSKKHRGHPGLKS